MYLEQLDRYEKRFKKAQLLILKSEDFFEKPEKIWRQLEIFLGLSKQRCPEVIEKANAGKNEARKTPQDIKEKLKVLFKETVQGIETRYGFTWKG